MPKREKVTEAFLRLALPPLKVDAAADDDDDDADDDDGRVGIWKAPLSDGTAELTNILLNVISQILI